VYANWGSNTTFHTASLNLLLSPPLLSTTTTNKQQQTNKNNNNNNNKQQTNKQKQQQQQQKQKQQKQQQRTNGGPLLKRDVGVVIDASPLAHAAVRVNAGRPQLAPLLQRRQPPRLLQLLLAGLARCVRA
jgi:ATP-dependent 26S proteasome regulatory subunit